MSVPELKRVLHATETANGLTVALPADLLFGGTPDTLSRTAGTALAELQRLIAALRPREIVVAGNTDGIGRDDANMKLSQERAQAVADWIGAHEARGRAHIVAKGYGRTRPVAPNTNPDGSDNPAGRALNRRIDVSLQG
jgi:outer membrane protein OmpA-like peptidoglycan-associated protein